jgi:radical SAM superfamily enzyme YgiQ (UPF0313 family)
MHKGLIFTGFAQYNTTAERPSGAYRIAHYIRSLGWDIEVIDYFGHWAQEELFQLLESRKDIKFIGLSGTWLIYEDKFIEFCFYLKEKYPHIKLIIGGNAISNEALPVDYFVNGFGELAIKAILDYEFGTGKKPYGVPYGKGWQINALDFYPSWPMENYEIAYESRDFLEPTDIISLELSRGCRFKCKFCNFPVLGIKEDTSVSEESMYQSIKQAYDKWGIKNFEIADETLNDRNEKLEKLSRAVQRCNWQPNFNAFVRADLFKSHPEQIDLLIGSRVWGQYYGIETFNHRSGKIVGKGLDPNQVKEILLNIKSKFKNSLSLYRGTISLISGLPYETIKDLENTHKWILENWKDQSWIMWNLGIPKPSKNIKPNGFTFDYEQYNFREMSSESIQREINKVPEDEQWRLPGETNPDVIWENENGNYFDFFKVARKIDAESSATGMLNNYHVWGRLSLGIPLDRALSESYSQPNPEAHHLLYTRTRNYIQKKLSL